MKMLSKNDQRFSATIKTQGTAGLSLCLAFVVCFFIISLAIPSYADRDGKAAPTPVLRSWTGEYIMFSTLYGDEAKGEKASPGLVAINFMGLNCPPCEIELPIFLETVRPLAEASPEEIKYYLVAIDPLSAREKLASYLKEKGVVPEREVLLDPYKKAAEKFGVNGIPRTFVIAASGEIVMDIEGAVADYREKLIEGINKARETAREAADSP